ncbi:MAG: hypothetical protein AAGN15_07670 [Cyanobacteria bacterium J06581_3]
MKRIIYGSLSVLAAIGTVFTAAKAEVFGTSSQETDTITQEKFTSQSTSQGQSVTPDMFGVANSGNQLLGATRQATNSNSQLFQPTPVQSTPARTGFSPQLTQVPGTTPIPTPVSKPSAGASGSETLTEEEAAVEEGSVTEGSAPFGTEAEAPVVVPSAGGQTLPSPGAGFTPGSAATPVVPANDSAQTDVDAPAATPVVPAAPDAAPLVPGTPDAESDALEEDSFGTEPAEGGMFGDEVPEEEVLIDEGAVTDDSEEMEPDEADLDEADSDELESDTVDESDAEMGDDIDSDGFDDGSIEMESDGFEEAPVSPDVDGLDESPEGDAVPGEPDVFTAPVPEPGSVPAPGGEFTPMPPADVEAPLDAPAESTPGTPLPPTPVAPPVPSDSFEPSEGDAFEADPLDSPTPLGSTSDRLIGEGFTPFQLSYLAIGGGLKEAGIPGGTLLLDAYEAGEISAEDIVNAGAMTKRLGTDANDEADYAKGVDKFLKLLSRQGLNS